MAVSKFCVVTEGRSGSTSLMEALESFTDIAVPGKNIDCPDNELVHARHIEKYCEEYTRICKKPVRTQAELISAFFELNDTDQYKYAGFKTMPNRHPDFSAFTARSDIRFITLQRRDIVSTTASFMTAQEKQSWRRHGEQWNEQWTFDPVRHGDAIRSNLQYIHESHQRLDSIPGAIRLYYEDICTPGYRNKGLDDFFMREIAIRDPKKPTTAASYVSNIRELTEFVENYWQQLNDTNVQPESSKTAVRSIPATAGLDTAGIHSFCQFLGYPVGGTTTLMAILNAHPDILIGHDIRLADLFRDPLHRETITSQLSGSVDRFIKQGCKENDQDYRVPNQWQGRYRQLKIIGNDSGTEAALYLGKDPKRPARLQDRLGMELKYIHIYRNPFDNIAIMSKKGKRSLRQATQDYFAIAAGIQFIRESVAADHFLDVCLEDLILEPATQLARMFSFLGMATDAGFLQDCTAAIFKSVPESRKRLAWKPEQVSGIRDHMQKFPVLHRFLDERYTPPVNPSPVRESALLDTPAEAVATSSPIRRSSPANQNRYPASGKDPKQCIVYAWELGMDLGHIMRFLPLALKLREAGYKVVFAIRDLQHAETVIGNQGFEVLQAPIWQAVPKNLQNPPLNYAEIILRYGFLTAPGLTGLVRAWRNLFEYTRAGLVVIDHAPSALLASHTMGLKRVTIGHGFFSPPQVSPTPNMRPWIKVPDKRLVSSDKIALDNSNQVIRALGGKPVAMLAELFRVEAEFLCTFAELDHYPDRKGARYWGPGFNVDEGEDLDWLPVEGKKIFAYVKPAHRDFDRLMTTLQQSGANILAYIPGISAKTAEKYESERFRISQAPVRLKKLRNECDLAICHAGIGTVAAFLLSGKPVLLLPTQLEQFLVATRVVQLGAGLLVNTDIKDEKPDYQAMLGKLLKDETFTRAAQTFAAKYSRFQPDAQYQAMTNVIRKLLPVTQG